MTTEIKRGTTRTLLLEPPSRWTGSISVAVKDLKDRDLEAPTATPDALDVAVLDDPDNSPSVVLVAAAGDIEPGRVYVVTSDAWGEARAKVAAVDTGAGIVTFAEPLPGTPVAGDKLLGVMLEVPITTATTGTAELNKRVIATHGSEEVVETVHVVEHPWRFPVELREIRDHILSHWPGHPRAADEAWIASIRDTADEDMRTRLVEAYRYAHRHWDNRTLRRAAWPAIYLALAARQLVPRGRDADQYETGQRFELRDRIAGLLKAPTPYDANGDGRITGAEAESIGAVIELTR